MPLGEITVPFALAVGTANTRTELPPIDLSAAEFIRMELVLTTAGTDAIDTLDVYLQEASDDVTPTWDDRAHFRQYIGTVTVTAAAPEKQIIQFWCTGVITATDASYEPSGSAGASRLAAGAFIPGRMAGLRRTSLGRQPRHRISFEQVDADSDANFQGTLHVWYESRP